MVDEKNQDNGAASEDVDFTKIMQEIAQEEAALTQEEPADILKEVREATVHSIHDPAYHASRTKPAVATEAGEKQSLSLELSGTMQIKLHFASGGRSIEISCSDDAMICKFADGTEFRIPVGKSQDIASKKSA